VDVDVIVDPLRQIVPTLLDVLSSLDDIAPRPAADVDELAATWQQDASKHAAESVDEETHPGEKSSSDAQRHIDAADNLTAESADEPKLSTDPVESTSDTLSVPNVASESRTGSDVVVRDTSDSEQT